MECSQHNQAAREMEILSGTSATAGRLQAPFVIRLDKHADLQLQFQGNTQAEGNALWWLLQERSE
jgi:hypothetical protein